MFKATQLKKIQKQIDLAENYEQWLAATEEYDEVSGSLRWRQVDQTRLYDHTQIRQRLDKLRSHRARQDNHGLLFTLNEGVHGNMGGMGRTALYTRSRLGTKNLIEDYVEEIADLIREHDQDPVEVRNSCENTMESRELLIQFVKQCAA